jgi:membrane-associated phospholipid phosphatase
MEQSPVDSTLNIFDRFAEEGSARLISDLGNPLLMPPAVFLGTGLLLSQSLSATLQVTGIAVICYSLLPFLLTIFMYRRGFIHSLDLPLRKTRTVLYAFSILSATTASLIIYQLTSTLHSFIFVLSLIFLANLTLSFLLNLKWKVSVHSASVSVAGTIYYLIFLWEITEYPLITLILSLIHLLLLLPVMMWARHHLGVHSLTELFGGATAGILLTIIELIIFTNIW